MPQTLDPDTYTRIVSKCTAAFCRERQVVGVVQVEVEAEEVCEDRRLAGCVAYVNQ